MQRRSINIAALVEAQKLGERTRVLTGTGTPLLPVKGLKVLEGIRVGQTEIPLVEERVYPKDRTGKHFENVDEEMVWPEVLPDGSIVLMRSVLSNHGIWQANSQIFVTGEWEDSAPQETPQGEAEASEAEASEVEASEVEASEAEATNGEAQTGEAQSSDEPVANGTSGGAQTPPETPQVEAEQKAPKRR